MELSPRRGAVPASLGAMRRVEGLSTRAAGGAGAGAGGGGRTLFTVTGGTAVFPWMLRSVQVRIYTA